MQARRAEVADRLAALGGTGPDEAAGRAWLEGRFAAPYLRDALLDVGVLVETLETATFWSRLPQLYAAVRTALTDTPAGRAGRSAHVSHVYETGASLYFTVAARQEADGARPVGARPNTPPATRSGAAGATITHHHAVGRDHRPWLADEVGAVGVEMLRAVKQRVDPFGVLNPGILVP